MIWHKRSLRFRLISILSVSALFIWLISTALAWWQVRNEVKEMFDAQQVLFAQRLATSDLHSILMERPQPHKGKHHKKPKYDDDALAFAIFSADGRMLMSDGENGENFIFAPQKGFSVTEIRGDDDKWRIFWQPAAGGNLLIAVGQELEYREELVSKMVLSQTGIWLASLPLLLILLTWVITRELRPLKRIGRKVANRTPEDSSQLKTQHLPTEVLPLVDSLNQFFARSANTLLRERRFTSDAAHELRSPLAALRIQTEVAQLAGDDVAMREQALQNLTKGIDRASQLIEKLLTLSRLDNAQQLEDLQPIEWQPLLSSVVGELYFSAQKRQMDIQLDAQIEPVSRQGQPLLLSLMVRNLIDNAIRYCPQGTQIDVRLAHNEIVIEDNGGGVSEADLAKLGQRFYRPAGQNEKGSGLGLSIVQRIAELHHFQLKLENRLNQQGERIGLRARILL